MAKIDWIKGPPKLAAINSDNMRTVYLLLVPTGFAIDPEKVDDVPNVIEVGDGDDAGEFLEIAWNITTAVQGGEHFWDSCGNVLFDEELAEVKYHYPIQQDDLPLHILGE